MQSSLEIAAEVMEEDVIILPKDTMLISLSYTESHPDKDRTFLGIFSKKGLAEKAMRGHMADEKRRLPYAHISEHNYSFEEARLDADLYDFAYKEIDL